MLSSNMQKGGLVTREAYLALLDLRSLVEAAVDKAHTAGLDTTGLTVSPQLLGDPLRALRIASQTLQSETLESMTKRKYSEVEMIGELKQLEAGRSAAEVGLELGVSKHTIYAWKAKYGGMTVGEAQGWGSWRTGTGG